jgi:hypothetical protein
MLRVMVAAAAAFIALAPTASFAQQSRIGVAAQVKNQVSATLSGATRTLGLGNNVFAGERIRTGQASNAQLTFLDQTNLTIGSQSDVVLDRFVYDPNRGTGNVALSQTQGALRFISGAQNPNAYRIDTPTATIAIRGTLAYNFIFGGKQYIVNGYGHVTAVLKAPGNPVVDIPPGHALVLFIPVDPTNPNYLLIKWELGLLDLDRLAQVLPHFETLPDSGNSLIDQHDATQLPPFDEYGGCECCECYLSVN